ncbi:hypothetical protein [Novipirellula galeiformis]|uniref:hypothetical protein n=1 Tax=Novipirellula galeiformis TaxID=2528004 RepID=UPI001E29FFE4|nr:hypothetical protein [Novipirellula galeiformis]
MPLSTVRFRTAVPATRDVAFELAAVVVGMAVGAGQYWVAGFGLLVVALATQFNRSETESHEIYGNGYKPKAWRLTLLVGLSATQGWESELKQFCESYQLASAEMARRGGAIELVYRVVPKADGDAVQLIATLNAIPTVESAAAKVVYAWATKSLEVSWQCDSRCQSPRFPLGDPAIKIGKMIEGQND